MDPEDLLYAGALAQAELIRTGRLRPSELVDACLARIDRLDPGLHAFSARCDDRARADAAAADRLEPDPVNRPLHGIPVAIKEEIDVAGLVTTFGGRAVSEPARQDAEVVRRLRAAGAIIVGKTAMPEFGQWPFTEGDWGMTANPWDRHRSPGGSSGGSAVAVATGMVPVAMGGDGGGSIRIPAASCGLFGLKPQRGRVSTAPHPHLWGILGTAGPLTRSVADSALVYDVIRGSTPVDRFRAGEPSGPYLTAATTDPAPLRIGWTTDPLVPGYRPSAEVADAVPRVAAQLQGLGHTVTPASVRFPVAPWVFPVLFYAGVLAELPSVSDPDRLERRTRQTVAIGRVVARPRVVAAAERAAERMAGQVDRAMAGYDLLVMPVLADTPPPLGRLSGTGSVGAQLRSVPSIAYTSLWNVTGHPAAAVPAGFSRTTGMPLSVQLVARRDDESTIFAAAGQLERAAPWTGRRPPTDT